MKKRIFSLILIICLLFSISINVNAFEITSFEVPANAAALYSLDTKEMIYSKNIEEKVYPASMVQIMAAIVILENVPDIENTEITMSQNAFNEILGTGAAIIHLKVGETLKCKDALAAMLVSSAGDAIYALSEAVGGSIEGFVEMMNNKATELGLTCTHYTNPIGLHDEEQYTCVKDIITLTQYATEKYPVFSELTKERRYSIPATNMNDARTIVTTNLMVDSSTNYFYSYCTGTKTGFTDEAGRCFTATAEYKGYRYLAVLMNCPTINGTRTEFTTAKEMFRWVFNNFEYKAVLDTAVPVAEMKVSLSTDYDYVSLYPENQLTSILPKDADSSTVIIRPNLSDKPVKAPIKKGDVLGTAEVIYAETVIGNVNLVAGNDIGSNIFLKILDIIKMIFTSLAFKIIFGILIFAFVLMAAYIYLVNFSGRKKNRKVRYIPYDEEKERMLKEKRRLQREKDGRPEYKDFDERD